ncbi:MAG: hypothetical protein GWM98_02475 [Nitrospinaceae bacterium]|nr:flagellar protein FlgN [Nitrospinaceae bacterium]NIR53570.1 flagellar protein FlgN [Nitrospinaceae bacterium]NIS83971.1 flagellar protein FlgN [Nitrospinaceae bacterium]NIT80780.1 flagellar protein FlgN [Nitrospinaceae bacterium]NIU43086.1 flagellar protein FlgN [Nitrospinaceae bacterium]
MSSTPTIVTRMLECLAGQKECYGQLLALAKLQKQAIEDHSDENLQQVMQDKNPVLLTLQALNEEMQTALPNLSETERALMIEQGKTLKDETAAVMNQLIEVENECAKFLEEKKEDLFQQLKILKESKNGLKGYGETGGKSSRFSQEG